MKLFKILALVASLWGLTACAGSIALDDLELPPWPEHALEPCAAPEILPERELTQYEVEAAWLQDRLALITCSDRQALAAEYAAGLRSALDEVF